MRHSKAECIRLTTPLPGCAAQWGVPGFFTRNHARRMTRKWHPVAQEGKRIRETRWNDTESESMDKMDVETAEEDIRGMKNGRRVHRNGVKWCVNNLHGRGRGSFMFRNVRFLPLSLPHFSDPVPRHFRSSISPCLDFPCNSATQSTRFLHWIHA